MSSKKDLSRIDMLVEIEKLKQMLDAMYTEVIILNSIVCMVADKVGISKEILDELCLREVKRVE